MTNETRVFFITDSSESNAELHETLEKAQAYKISALGTEPKARVYIGLVRNYYYEPDLKLWNYEDLDDTFTFIKEIK